MSDRTDPVEAASDVADRLLGTAQSLGEALEELGIPERIQANDAFTGQLDALVFECISCGWWHDHGEMSSAEDWTCTSCNPETENED